MQYLNLIYAIILAAYGYKFLQSDGKIVKGVLNNNEHYHYSGTELFWCLTFATGCVALSLNIGLDLMALRLLILDIFCIIGLRISRDKAILNFPLKLYIAFLIWMVIGLFYSPYPDYGIRTILKYLYPLLLCAFASACVRDEEVFFKSSIFARNIGVIALIYTFFPYLSIFFPEFFWYGTARAIHFISLMIFSLGMFYFTNQKRKNLICFFLFLLPCIITVLRTSIFGSAIGIMAFFLIKYRIKAIPIIFTILVIGVSSIFLVPSIRQKTFYHDNVTLEDFREGRIEKDNVNTNYREYMWEKLQSKFYNDSKLTGSGTGTEQGYMYTHAYEFNNLKICHSDFVQQKCDNGLIGLILYGAMIFFIFVDCFRTYWRTDYAPLKLCAIVAGASLLGVYATFYSDNTVNYSMATLSMPFGFYGMMLGMRRKLQQDGAY